MDLRTFAADSLVYREYPRRAARPSLYSTAYGAILTAHGLSGSAVDFTTRIATPRRSKGPFDPARGSHRPVCWFKMPMPTYTGTLSVAAEERWLVFPKCETEDSGLSVLAEIPT